MRVFRYSLFELLLLPVLVARKAWRDTYRLRLPLSSWPEKHAGGCWGFLPVTSCRGFLPVFVVARKTLRAGPFVHSLPTCLRGEKSLRAGHIPAVRDARRRAHLAFQSLQSRRTILADGNTVAAFLLNIALKILLRFQQGRGGGISPDLAEDGAGESLGGEWEELR